MAAPSCQSPLSVAVGCAVDGPCTSWRIVDDRLLGAEHSHSGMRLQEQQRTSSGHQSSSSGRLAPLVACVGVGVAHRRWKARRRNGCKVRRLSAGSSEPQRLLGGRVPWIDGLREVADKYDAFLFDIWGVVHNGSVSFPWAIEVLRQLRDLKKPVVFLSNSSRRRQTNAANLEKMGITPDLYADIVTSGEETWRALSGEGSALTLPADIQEASNMLTFGNGSDDADYVETLSSRRASGIGEADLLLARGCAAVYEGSSSEPKRKATFEDFEELLRRGAERRLPLLVANPDSVRPDGSDSPMPGPLQCLLFAVGLDRLQKAAGVAPDARVCMVGDSVWHDVRGARAAGLDVILLCTGVHSKALGVPQAPNCDPAADACPSRERAEAFFGALTSEELPTYVAPAAVWTSSTDTGPTAEAVGGAGAHVVCCGLACVDLLQNVDSYPEADAKVRTSSSSWHTGGNAANTARALAQLGTNVSLVSKIGTDSAGKTILDDLAAAGVDTACVLETNVGTSAFSTVLVSSGDSSRTCIHTPMVDGLTASEARQMLEDGRDDCRPFSAKSSLLHLDCRHPEAAVELAKAAKKQGLLLSIDAERPRPGLDDLLPLCDAIFCSASFPLAWTGEKGLPAALAKVLERCESARFVLATRGERGSLLLARGSDPDLQLGEGVVEAAELPLVCCCGSFRGYKTLACDAWPLAAGEGVVDSTGAGDVFIAGFLNAWLSGYPLSMSMARGSYVASQKLRVQGASLPPDFKMVDGLL
eukprot:TRINITY_DN44192_c0_g1_i2.p1 TRINITY_DN44192_c0_g1~~TRINITY_DN44192_c0_g1_i2.p1  ORF type:complete len:774 (+),score=148.31 TRINITY_DN44192_c0_g1_i2:47-2323(+)